MQSVAVADIHEISRGWKYLLNNASSEKHQFVAYVTGRTVKDAAIILD